MTKCTKFDPNQRKGFESTWMSLSGPKCTWFCLPLAFRIFQFRNFPAPDQLIQRKSCFFKHIVLPYPRVVVLQCWSALEIFCSGKVSTRAGGRHSALFHSQQVSKRNRRMWMSTRKYVIHIPVFATEMSGRIIIILEHCLFFGDGFSINFSMLFYTESSSYSQHLSRSVW